MGLGSLAKRWLRRDLKPACTYMKGNDKDNGAKLSMLVASYTEKSWSSPEVGGLSLQGPEGGSWTSVVDL